MTIAYLIAIDHFGFWRNSNRLIALSGILTVLTTASAAFFAWRIGQRANGLLRSQREIAGLAVLRDVRITFFEDDQVKRARRYVAETFLAGNPVQDRHGVGRVLNVLEEVGVYVHKRYITADAVSDLLAHWTISYWYACESYIRTARDEFQDNEIWNRLEQLVEMLHRVSLTEGVEAWAHKPDQQVLARFFQYELDNLALSEE